MSSNLRFVGLLVTVVAVAASTLDAAPLPVRMVAPQTALPKPAKFVEAEVPLTDLPAKLTELFKIPVYLDRRGIDQTGLALDQQIKLSGQFKTLGEGLSAVLKPAELTWALRGEVLVITAQVKADQLTEIRAYLVTQAIDPDALHQEIVKVEPASWAEVGGTGMLRAFGPRLMVIATTASIQGQVAAKFAGTMRVVPHAEVKIPHSAAPLLLRALAKSVNIELVDTPMNKALEQLSREHKLAIAIDSAALKEAGTQEDFPLNLNLHGIKLGTALALLLDSADLTYVPDKAGLLVTSQAGAHGKEYSVSYPAADLAPNGDAVPLTDMVTMAVNPTTWTDVGGTGTIQFDADNGMLVVKNTFDTHRKLEQLLTDVRSAFGR